MKKKIKSPSAILRKKENRLDWHKFNFLENLLIFCAVPERRVPKESGVHFSISSTSADQAITLLFEIDRKKDPLILGQGIVRPDYMALYVKRDTCICTIIEMKGKDEGKLKHGIEQIRELKRRLVREIRDCLPLRWKVAFQGLLLTPPNTQIPFKQLIKVKKEIHILPLSYLYKFELFPYISKINEATERYKHRPRRGNHLGFIETLISKQALQKRMEDAFYTRRIAAIKNKEGFYVNFVHPDTDDYTVLFATNKSAVIAVRESGNSLTESVKKELGMIGIQEKIDRFEKI